MHLRVVTELPAARANLMASRRGRDSSEQLSQSLVSAVEIGNLFRNITAQVE
jgi:hypothetical protein